jgi:uncharacterized membrane protein
MFLHFFISGFRLESILSRSRDSCLEAVERISVPNKDNDDDKGKPSKQDLNPQNGSEAYKVMSDKSGYITRFSLDLIVEQAQEADVFVRYNRHVGDYVAEHTLLAHVWDAKTRDEEKSLEDRISENILSNSSALSSVLSSSHDTKSLDELDIEEKLGLFIQQGVVMDGKRTGDFDVTFGIQQLSDIAMRALSPGINDPQTAIQCMDVLSEVLGHLACIKLAVPHAVDQDGILRVCAPRRSFSYFLSQLDPIRHYGQNDLAVCRRGIRLFGDLGCILTRRDRKPPKRDGRVRIVLAQMDQWLSVAKENFTGPELKSLQALYDHERENITDSMHPTAKHADSVDQDLQDLEVTHKEDE